MNKQVIIDYVKELEVQKLFYEEYKDFMSNSELWIEWYKNRIRYFKKELGKIK